MLVDDAVVVVEAIYYRMERGQAALQASLDAVAEVWKPVLASVATTMAAFLPLMLLPGIVGKFMFVIPFVVTLALLISLVEAFWMMPVHVQNIGLRFDAQSREQRWRDNFNRTLRLRYGQALAYALRRPKRFAAMGVGAVVGLLIISGTGDGADGACACVSARITQVSNNGISGITNTCRNINSIWKLLDVNLIP
jgi:multidrug efflux pump subunit AcrB